MKKFLSILIIFIFTILISLAATLSTIGIETNRFNNLISQKINHIKNKINLKLTTVKFKFDLKEISLFLETRNSQIEYREVVIPTQNIKVYIDFLSLINFEPKIKKINLVLNRIDIKDLKKISVSLKPSNFNSFINNNINHGKLSAEIKIFFDDNNLLDDFIARGSVSDLKAEIINEIHLEKTNFNFFADKSDILLKNIFCKTGPFEITDGDLKLNLSSEISLESNFKTKLKFNNQSESYRKLVKNLKFIDNISDLDAVLNNSFFIKFDDTYKIKKYDLSSSGKIIKSNLDLKKPYNNYFLDKKIDKLTLINSKIITSFSSKKKSIDISGKYSLNTESPLSFSFSNRINGDLLNFKLNADYNSPFELNLINYKKQKESTINLSLNLDKNKNKIKINELKLLEGENSIIVEDIAFKNNKFLSLKKISVKTNKDGNINNNFFILYDKKITIKGAKFDASNLPKILNNSASNDNFSDINKDIEIDFKNIIAPLSENLKNFKLIGKIEKGKFTKISSKGDFGNNNFLDITMKKNTKDKKKYLEIYSDLTKPLLTEYSFFKGLNGGKLLFSSVIDDNDTISKLKIENFTVTNAPGMLQLLSLADLGGLADLAEGEGLSFDLLEIKMKKKNDLLKLNEILALGPSISVLMEGYQSPEVTSLRGTLVPAKTLNKMISKIPVLGEIIIPKEVGEGLFGISFKMKGPPGKIKTTINPIRTITPRFIQKIIDRNKDSK